MTYFIRYTYSILHEPKRVRRGSADIEAKNAQLAESLVLADIALRRPEFTNVTVTAIYERVK